MGVYLLWKLEMEADRRKRKKREGFVAGQEKHTQIFAVALFARKICIIFGR